MDRQLPLDPYTLAEVDEPWRNRSAGVKGSAVKHEAFTQSMEEIVYVIEQAGLTPDAEDLTQLWQALQRQLNMRVRRVDIGPTLYVRTDGNDANDGSANDSAHAFATIRAAVLYGTRTFFLVGQTLIIQLGNPGSYANPGALECASANVRVVGSEVSPASYLLVGPPPVSSGGLISGLSGNLDVVGVTIVNAYAGSQSVIAAVGAKVSLGTVVFSQTVGGVSILIQASGGVVSVAGGCLISGDAGTVLGAVNGGKIELTGTLALSAGLTFNTVALATGLSLITRVGGAVITGTATGVRFAATTNSVIDTAGGGANFFPGSSPGTTASGAQYV